MQKTKVTSGMWRIDPLNRLRVVDRYGRTVATAESESDASLIATAPDMYEVLDSVENDEMIPPGLWEEIQIALRRARGDLGLIFSCCGLPRIRQVWNREWLNFVEKLWGRPLGRGTDRENVE